MTLQKNKSVFRKKAVVKNTANTLSPRLANLIYESWLLVLAAIAIYIGLALFSHSALDSSWSHSSNLIKTHNLAGRIGASVSDLLFYTLGYSAWSLIVFCLIEIAWGYNRITHKQIEIKERQLTNKERAIGMLLILISTSCLEFLFFGEISSELPLCHGGLLGRTFGTFLQTYLGFYGAALMLGIVLAIAISLIINYSWLNFAELIGAFIEKLFFSCFNFIASKFHKDDLKIPTLLEPAQGQPSLIPATFTRKRTSPNTSLATVKEDQKPAKVKSFSENSINSLPMLDLLDKAKIEASSVSDQTLENISLLIERKLAEFGVQVKVVGAHPGPVITRYEIEPATGIKGSQIVNLIKDLARALSLVSIRVVETIPGKTYMGLELPNDKRQIVRLSEIIGAPAYSNSDSLLTIAMGKDIAGEPVIANLSKMPHVLVAGTTGSGKSVAINAIILSLLFKATPEQIRLIMIDPKMLELSVYEGIPHLLAPVVTDMKQAANALNWCVGEMERRYKLMSKLGVRNLAGFNQKIHDSAKNGCKITNPFSLTPETPEPLEEQPTIVVIIDELADLMMVAGKKIEELIARLAQKARASGIHLVLATQRPSVDVITGLIKANIPTRIAFQVSSKIDSRTILDQMGAESLLGQGDMLYLPPGSGYPSRVHGAFVSDEEVHKVVEFIKTTGEPNYIDGILSSTSNAESGSDFDFESDKNSEQDELYDQAVAIVLKTRRASISSVQRQLRIGYNRAARLIENMEAAGLVSAMETNGNRTVLAPQIDE